MQEEESKAVRSLMASSCPRPLRSRVRPSSSNTLVLSEDGAPVAAVTSLIRAAGTRKVATVIALATDKEHQRSGCASRLFKAETEKLWADGCTDIVASCEGDDGETLRILADCGFTLLSPVERLRRFGFEGAFLFRCLPSASGWWLYHACRPAVWHREPGGAAAFLCTALFNLLLWIPVLRGWNILRLLFPSVPFFQGVGPSDRLAGRLPLLYAVPLLFLFIRTGAMYLSAMMQKVAVSYRSWDRGWLLSVLCPLFLGVPLPWVGSVLISGTRWTNDDMDSVLALLSRSEVLALAFCCLLLKGSIAETWGIILLYLDALACFYPFSGYGSPRVMKRGLGPAVTPLVTCFVTTFYLFV